MKLIAIKKKKARQGKARQGKARQRKRMFSAGLFFQW